jgi:hypothetical protein
MQASKQRLVAVNARVNSAVHRQFGIAVAHRGITKQRAVEEALRLWIDRQEPVRRKKMTDAPLIRSDHPGKLHLTGADIDEILFG